MEDKVSSALRIIQEAVNDKEGVFAVFLLDDRGLVLLDLLKKIGNGRITAQVLCVQFQPLPKEALCFADKLRRMWNFDLDIERLPAKTGGVFYTEKEMSDITAEALSRRKARTVLSPCTAPSDDRASSVRQGYTELWPLCNFNEDDIREYACSRRLPKCSLDKKVDDARTASQTEGKEDAMLREKLKSLGYI